ncbi:TPA: murein transglycosylase A [Neisseria lactamica]|uniref:murein transglycosylase A n=1 Tax=Neisseria lactamica TaxID=486 RepID=UPI0027E1B0B4|nr:murein transglycosylase A [Neisseria lactamica]
MKKYLFRAALCGIAAAILAACQSKSIQTFPQPDTSVIKGPDRPAGIPDPAGTTVGGGGAVYTVVPHLSLPHWAAQDFAKSLQSFRLGCANLKNRQGWQDVCAQAFQTPVHSFQAKQFFERYFTPWQVAGNGSLAGTVTGYYEPVLKGDDRRTEQARFPIYGIPDDFISVPLPAGLRGGKTLVRIRQTGKNSGTIDNTGGTHTADLSRFPITARTTAIKGRFEGSRFLPYHTRNQINGGALDGKAPILGYAEDPVELFFMHIQGSGRLKTPSGKYIRIGYADKNEHPYVSIGKYMADKGYLKLGQTSMQGIKSYMRQNPQRLAEVLGQNPSYVFFRELAGSSNDGPVGALGTPLMGEYAGAVDRHYITLGAPLFVATAHPVTRKALNRLIMAQDTGSAIKGAVRVDYFWGYGDEAGETAGKMKEPGYVWQLLPNGMKPEYRP